MSKYHLYVDGGGTPTVPTYFSYKCIENSQIEMNRFYLTNLAPELLPEKCSIYDDRKLSTNNIAEYAALAYGLKRFRQILGLEDLIVYQDSELIVKQVNGEYQCRQPHLQQWLKAVHKLWWTDVKLQWVPREEIVEILGH